MKANRFYLILLFFLLFIKSSNSQPSKFVYPQNEKTIWFISSGLGLQMSGIKNEDFIISNYSPLFNISVGKWFVPYLALQIGYRGLYFNTISDESRHYYNFFYGEVVLNISGIEHYYSCQKKWSVYLHGGSGYFYNYTYNRPNICAILGIQNNYKVSRKLKAIIDISAIMGWDLYQGDEDILPGILTGLSYQF